MADDAKYPRPTIKRVDVDGNWHESRGDTASVVLDIDVSTCPLAKSSVPL